MGLCFASTSCPLETPTFTARNKITTTIIISGKKSNQHSGRKLFSF